MRRATAIRVLLVLLALCGPARADILLDGNQHIGDNEGAESGVSFVPSDPVTRAQMSAYPTRFHLSQQATITAVRFDNALSLDGQIRNILIDGVTYTGTLSGNTFSFPAATPVGLAAGLHTIFPDPGCRNNGGNPVACTSPAAKEENDIGFSSLTLISAQTTTSRMLNRRHNVGDDSDSNDNYDVGSDSQWYPDASEGVSLDIGFSIDANRSLTQMRFYRLRDVDSTNPLDSSKASVSVDGTFVGRLLYDQDGFVLLPNLSLNSGSHTLHIDSGVIGPGNRDTISWDDIVLQFSASTGAMPGRFNAVEVGADATSGPIHTRVAGSAFGLDLIALDSSGTTLLSGYAGTVTVELLDASNNTGRFDPFGCRASWTTLANLGSYTFSAAGGGRLNTGLSLVYAASFLKEARLRVSDASLGVEGCSFDAFALRPGSFSLQVSDSNATSSGTGRTLNVTSTTGTPTHRAGQPFTLRVTPLDAAATPASKPGYQGAPNATASAAVTGTQLGTLMPGSWFISGSSSAIARTDTAQYGEAGAFTLRVNDDQFANIDLTDGSTAAEREVPATTISVGRFTPDHFVLLSRAAQLAAACGSFSYEGQAMSFLTAPQVVLQAVDSAGNSTRNYTGGLFRLGTTLGSSSYNAINGSDGAAVTLSPATLTTSVADSGQGQATLSFGASAPTVVRSTPRAPIDLEVELDVATVSDADGIVYADLVVTPLRIGRALSDQGIAFSSGANLIRFGRLFLQNAYGSELQPLDVAFGAEYVFDTSGGFTRNLADGCTSVTAPTLSGTLAASTSAQSISSPLVAGLGNIRLAAPAGGAVGSVSLRMTPPAWLLVDSDANAVFDNPVDGLASFGMFRQGDHQIYLRETYR